MWRKVMFVIVVGLLVSGLFGETLAEKPPIKGDLMPGPGPRPIYWGDPDWPAYCRPRDTGRRFTEERAGELLRSDGVMVGQSWWGSISDIRADVRSPQRRYVVRILGLTIVIRR